MSRRSLAPHLPRVALKGLFHLALGPSTPSGRDENVGTDEEVHMYVRHTSHLLVLWFTFFGLANLAATGWCAFRLKEDLQWGDQAAILIIALFFVVQGALAVKVCRYMRAYFSATQAYLSRAPSDANRVGIEAPSAIALYERLTLLMLRAILCFVLVWIVLILAAFLR